MPLDATTWQDAVAETMILFWIGISGRHKMQRMQPHYFVKRNNSDSSFHSQLTEEELRKQVARGSIKPDWLIT